MAEIDSVIKKIKGLLAKTISNGASEFEAISAMVKAGELLQVYNLELSQVFLNSQNCVTLVIDTDFQRRVPILRIIGSIAEFCDCKSYTGWSNSNRTLNFFGLETDTILCKYLFETIENAVERETEDFKNSDSYQKKSGWHYGDSNSEHVPSRKTRSVNFQKGMIDRISYRLQEMTRERKIKEKKESPIIEVNGMETSIVLIKNDKVEQEYDKIAFSLGLRSFKYSSSRYDKNSYSAGTNAGQKVNLDRALPNAHNQKALN